MNYSANEDYWDKCQKFGRREIKKNKIKKRWFRNWYVLYQSKGYFTHNTFVLHFGEFNPDDYSGTYYGPFTEKNAVEFAMDLKAVHENYILGG